MLNSANTTSNADPTGWDHIMTPGLGQGSVWGNPYLEKLIVGDIETYGPRGSNVYAFNLFEQIPEQYYGPLLATSWEIQTTPTVVFTWHLRKGVMWQGNQKIGMAPRELTSDDVVYSELRSKTRPGFTAQTGWLFPSVIDKYTVRWDISSWQSNWAWRWNGTALGQIWAKETVAAGPDDWRNHTGTGPYILTDFVSGGGATYTRNPNYWGTTTIGGKSYQMPFIQTVIYPVIPDESTQIAAIRTGKIDWDVKVKSQYQPTLKQTSPDLILAPYQAGVCDYLKLNRISATSPMNNKNLRRALMIATDLNTITTVVYGGGVTFSWPLAPGAVGFTPFAQLPADLQEDWTYSISDAKQIMTAAGYPNGFKVEIMVSGSSPQQVDLATALVAMWGKAGITANINVADSAAVAVAFDQVTYKDMLVQNFTVVNSLTSMNISKSGTTAGSIYNPNDPIGQANDALWNAANGATDPVVRNNLIAKLSVQYAQDVGTIGFANPNVFNAYWPWFKNYYGELDASYYNGMPMIERGWIDQTMKKALGK
jgi:peptide/nickel transport system substrate-binding protein